MNNLISELLLHDALWTSTQTIERNEFIFKPGEIEREIDILTFSPAERLNRVQERSPHLFQEIPSKYIAAYLRMTPETLSRIRKSWSGSMIRNEFVCTFTKKNHED